MTKSSGQLTLPALRHWGGLLPFIALYCRHYIGVLFVSMSQGDMMAGCHASMVGCCIE